jgi:hypothetical protein
MLVQKWIEQSIQAAVKITLAQPFRGAISVMLIGIPAIAGQRSRVMLAMASFITHYPSEAKNQREDGP